MPKVQSYNPGQVKANPLPASRFSANATAESFGGGDAATLGRMGASLQDTSEKTIKLAADFGEQKDKAVAREALVTASDLRLKAGEQVWQLKGKDATEAYNRMNERLTKIREESSKNLTPRQREYFLASFDSQAEDYKSKAMMFQIKAVDDYEKLTLTAENQSAIDNAIANRNDPNAIRSSENTIGANTLRLLKGIPKDAEGKTIREQALATAQDNLHQKILGAIEQDSPVVAKKYFEENIEKFSPGARDAMRKELEVKAFDYEVRTRAVGLSNSGMSLEDQLKEADKLEDPKMADELRKRVKEKYEDKKLAKEAADATALKTEWDNLLKDPKNYKIPYGTVTYTQSRAMEKALARELNPDRFPDNSDRSTLMKYGLMSDQELRNVPVDEISAAGDQLAKPDWTEVFKRYTALNGGTGAGEVSAKLTQIRTDSALLTDTLNALGVKTDKGKNQDVVNRLFTSYQAEVSQEEVKLGRKLTPPEKQQVVDDLFVKGKVGFFSSKRVFEMAPNDWKNFSVKEVPQKEQVEIVEYFNRKGLPVTKEAIRAKYLEYLESRRK